MIQLQVYPTALKNLIFSIVTLIWGFYASKFLYNPGYSVILWFLEHCKMKVKYIYIYIRQSSIIARTKDRIEKLPVNN